MPLDGFGPKVNTNVRGHEYFIPTKFGEYPSSDSVVKADYVFPYIHIGLAKISVPSMLHFDEKIKFHEFCSK